MNFTHTYSLTGTQPLLFMYPLSETVSEQLPTDHLSGKTQIFTIWTFAEKASLPLTQSLVSTLAREEPELSNNATLIKLY